jgi:hypothetical protein
MMTQLKEELEGPGLELIYTGSLATQEEINTVI